MADTYCTAQEPLALGMLEAFFAPRRLGCEVPEWSVRKRKSASSGFSAGGFLLGVYVQSPQHGSNDEVKTADFEARPRGLLQGLGTSRRSNP